MIRDNGGWENFSMTPIKSCPCENSKEALREEDRIMREMKSTMNSYRSYVSPEDFC